MSVKIKYLLQKIIYKTCLSKIFFVILQPQILYK